jgi:predicted NBD/HSP70 family sugar kinase
MIGLELDEHHVLAVDVDEQGRVVARARIDAAGDLGAAAASALEQVRTAAAASSHPVGIAAANPDSPVITAAVAQLSQRSSGSFNGHGAILSGTAAAVAEAWIGAARGVKDVVFFAVSQHATGGVIRDGVAVTSARGRANSVAWLSLNPVEREDYRKTGCLEAEVSAPGIVRRLIWRIKAGDRSRVQEDVKDDLTAITMDLVLEAARSGDGVSISVLRDTAKYLGMAAANLVVVADPEMVVLGGIMASASDLFLEPVKTEISRRLPKSIMDALRIEVASLGADAASMGAARLAAAARQ